MSGTKEEQGAGANGTSREDASRQVDREAAAATLSAISHVRRRA